MSPQFNVAADESAWRAGAIGVTVASLPVSLRHDPASDAELLAVDGAAGWPARLSGSSARAIVLIEPEPVAEVPKLTVPVVVDRVYAGNPAIATVREQLSQLTTDALLEIRVTVPAAADSAAALPGILALARAVAAPVAELSVLSRGDHGLSAVGELSDGRPVVVAVTASDAVPESARIRAVDAARLVEATLPSNDAARPAVVVASDEAGATQAPTLYETSHRFAWRRACAAVESGSEQGDDLTALAADHALLSRVFDAPHK